MSKIEYLVVEVCHFDATLKNAVHGLLAALLLAIRRRAAVVPQEVHQLVDVRRCCERTGHDLKNRSTSVDAE